MSSHLGRNFPCLTGGGAAVKGIRIVVYWQILIDPCQRLFPWSDSWSECNKFRRFIDMCQSLLLGCLRALYVDADWGWSVTFYEKSIDEMMPIALFYKHRLTVKAFGCFSQHYVHIRIRSCCRTRWGKTVLSVNLWPAQILCCWNVDVWKFFFGQPKVIMYS